MINDQLWQSNVGVETLGELLTSNMVIVRKRTVKIYDIWPDKDDEVTEVGEAISGLFVYEKSQMRVIFNAIICCRFKEETIDIVYIDHECRPW